MSNSNYIPLHDNSRYDVSLFSNYENGLVSYRLEISDLTIGMKYEAIFRFSQIKKFHEQLIKKYENLKGELPQLPKTNSFVMFWNRTNKDHRKIEDRRRQLQFYFEKVLNNPSLIGMNQIKGLLLGIKKVRNKTESLRNFESIRKGKNRIKSLEKTN